MSAVKNLSCVNSDPALFLFRIRAGESDISRGGFHQDCGIQSVLGGIKQGFFAQQGLDVQPVVIRGSDRSIQALVGGSVYAALLAPDAPLSPPTAAWMQSSSPATRSVWRIGFWAGKNYKTFDDLRGATVGTISLTAGTGLVLRHVLRAKGLEYPRDYKLLIIGGTPQLFTALTANQIAAAPLALPFNLPPKKWVITPSAASWQCFRVFS